MQKSYSTKSGPSIPSRSNHFPSCLYETSKIALSPTSLSDYGIFLEFEVPKELPPSFRGCSGIMTYYLTLSVQSPCLETKLFHFPILFSGAGAKNSITAPYTPKFSNTVAYAASSIPVEVILSKPQDIYAEIGYRNEDSAQNGHYNIYNVRDEDYICSIILKQEKVFAGDQLIVTADFGKNVQACKAIHLALIQCERRVDRSIIQQKIISSVTRYSFDAHILNMALDVGADLTCSFDFALFSLDYQLELEFRLPERRDASCSPWDSSAEKSLSFSIPITIAPLPAIGCDKRGMNIDSSACRQYLIHECLERKAQSFPQLEI